LLGEARLIMMLPAASILLAAILCVSWLALSGAIHFDGLMDTADGIFSHRSVDRMLEIMRDSRVGNFGAITGICVLILKVAALSNMRTSLLLAALILVPVWARWCECYAIGYFTYAREEGMGKIWHDSTKYPRDGFLAAIVPLIVTAVCAFKMDAITALVLTGVTIMVGILAAHQIASVIKGHTGDTYGAVVELAEVGGLLIAALVPLP